MLENWKYLQISINFIKTEIINYNRIIQFSVTNSRGKGNTRKKRYQSSYGN